MAISFIKKFSNDVNKLLGIKGCIVRCAVDHERPKLLDKDTVYYLFDHYNGSTVYLATSDNNSIGSFRLFPMPGCCGVAITTDAHVYIQYRRKGIGTLMNNFAKTIARRDGFKVLLATDIAANTHQAKAMLSNKFKKLLRFKNKRTGNNVDISAAVL